MAPPPILIGFAFAVVTLLVAWLLWQARAALAPSNSIASPWAPWVAPWSASTGNGGDGAEPPPRRHPRPNPVTIEDLDARRPLITRWLRGWGALEKELPDLTQQTIQEAWIGRDRYDPARADLNSWIYIIARNLMTNLMRSVWIQRVDLQDMAAARLAAEGDPESALVHAEQLRRAQAIVERLEPRLASIWTRYELDGLGMRAVANELGVGLSTCWGRLQSARVQVARMAARENAIEAGARERRRRRR
jgi:RNA polymerase sigma factor (sigma-70 family)